MKIEKNPRKFIAVDLKINAWEDIKSYFDNLLNRKLNTKEDFEKWLEDRSELDAVLEEDMAWRYIRMSIDTTNETFSAAYNLFVTKIQPELAPLDDQLNRKLVDCPFKDAFKNEEAYKIYFRATDMVQLVRHNQSNTMVKN